MDDTKGKAIEQAMPAPWQVAASVAALALLVAPNFVGEGQFQLHVGEH